MNDIKNKIILARKGDTQAFADLYSTMYKEMYYTALYNLRSEHDACDVVSETAIDAFVGIKKLKNANAFSSWIMKILFTKIKKMQGQYSNTDTVPMEEIQEPWEDFEYSASELECVLNSLDDKSKGILSLSVLGGYSSYEIGKIYNMRPSAVRSSLTRIKKRLRIEFED